MGKSKRFLSGVLRWSAYILLSVLLLFAILVLVIRIPSVQSRIIHEITREVAERTGAQFEVDQLYLTYSGSLDIRNLYLATPHWDTILYANQLNTGIAILPIFQGTYQVSHLQLDGLRLNLIRGEDSIYNYSFIIDAFAQRDSSVATADAATDTSNFPAISVGPLSLSDFRVRYIDSVSGIHLSTAVNELQILPSNIDLQDFKFEVNSLNLDGSRTIYNQFKPLISDTTSVPSTLPFIAWQNIQIKNSTFNYLFDPIQQELSLSLEGLEIEESNLDLSSSSISAGDLLINSLSLSLIQGIAVDEENENSDSELILPEWKIELSGITINESNLDYRVKGAPKKAGFDPNDIQLNMINLKIAKSSYTPDLIDLNLDNISLNLNQEFSINKLSLNALMDQHSLKLDDFILNTQKSSIKTELELGFQDLSELVKNPNSLSNIYVFLPSSEIWLNDLLYFQPWLDTLPYMSSFEKHPIRVSGEAKGTLENLSFDRFFIHFLEDTELQLSGLVKGLPETAQLEVNLPSIALHTVLNDIVLFLDTSGLTLPRQLDINGQLKGGLYNNTSSLNLKSDLGSISADIELESLETNPKYKAVIDASQFDLARIIGIPDLDLITAHFEVEGLGIEPSIMETDLQTSFSELTYRGYNYNNLLFNGSIDHGDLKIQLDHKSPELAMTSQIDGRLDSLITDLELQLYLEGARLRDLGLTNEDYKVGFDLQSHFTNQKSVMSFSSNIKKILLIQGSNSYRLDSIFADLTNSNDSSQIAIYSNFLSADVYANSSLQDLANNVKYHAGFTVDTSLYNPEDYLDFSMRSMLVVVPDPFLTDILLPDLEEFDSLNFEASYTPLSEVLQANLFTSTIQYGPRRLDNLSLLVNTNKDQGKLELSFDGIRGPYVDIGKTALALNRINTQGTGSLLMLSPEGFIDYSVNVNYEKNNGQYAMSINNDSLILNEEVWEIDPENYMSWGSELFRSNKLDLTHKEEQLSINTPEDQDALDISFKNFDLNVIFGLLNNERDIISGQLNGDINLVNLSETPGFTAKISLSDLALTKVPLGKMDLFAENTSLQNFNMELKLEGPEILFTANGDYDTDPQHERIDFDLNLERLGIPLLEKLFPQTLDSSTGSLSAQLKVFGNLKHPDYNGVFEFKEVQVLPKQLGTTLRLSDERISLDQTAWHFESFEVLDPLGSKIVLNGDIKMKEALNPSYDLTLKADNFQLLQAAQGENELYFGKVLADLDIKLKGTKNLPIIRSKITLGDETDFTYVVPASQAQIESQNGIVMFENMKDTLDILSTDNDQQKTVTGYDIQSRVILKNGTQLRMLLDPRSGDNMTITGAADLNYTLSPNGNMNLTGEYQLNDGGYKLNLYDLVKKEFKIRKGSRIDWTGSPMGAALNITAVYETKASASSIMDDPDPRYNRTVPFQVLLFIKGTLEQPEISFLLDIPSDDRSALGGDVYSKIKQVNTDEAELNKQVFALIVFDRFIPSSNSGDPGLSTADIARSSVSDFLSGQLNNLSERYLKGVELDVNIESYRDYAQGGGQERTDLNLSLRKAFFDDRVVVEVGSNMAIDGYQRSNDVIGDLAIEYLLTEDGTYRLRGYRRNDYQSPVEGEVIITGMALIFSREFNTWDQLLKRPEAPKESEGTKPEEEEEEEPREEQNLENE